jgi:hypothetical protein
MRAALQFTIAVALLAAAIALPFLLYSHARREQSEREEIVLRQTQQLAELSAENEQLSNRVAQAGPSALPDEQRRELLKLRGGIGQLRQAANEIQQLRAANQGLSSSNSSAPAAENASPRPDPKTVLAYWPKDQLTPAGYADPQSALRTFLSAINRGDLEALLASVSVPADAKAEVEELIKTEAGQANGRKLAETFAPYTAFYVTGQRMPSETHAILDVYFEGDGKTRKVALERIGQDWKFKTMGRPGQSDEDLGTGPDFTDSF